MSATGSPKRWAPPRAPLADAFGTTVAASATPYGYTVCTWSTGALLMGRHGVPGFAEVAGFAAGALGGFTLLGALARRVRRGEPVEHGPHRVAAGMLNWVAVGLAAGAAAPIARLHGWLAWPLASASATVLYLLVASAQLALAARQRT